MARLQEADVQRYALIVDAFLDRPRLGPVVRALDTFSRLSRLFQPVEVTISAFGRDHLSKVDVEPLARAAASRTGLRTG